MQRIALLLMLLCAPGCHQNIRPRWEFSLQVGTESKLSPETTVTTSFVIKRATIPDGVPRVAIKPGPQSD